MNTYLDVVCYRSKILADGTSPIMLRLTKDGKRKYISLHLSANQSNWYFKKNTPKRNCPERDAILSVIERKSKQYREQITQFKVEGKDYTLETLVQRVENPVRQDARHCTEEADMDSVSQSEIGTPEDIRQSRNQEDCKGNRHRRMVRGGEGKQIH